MLTHSHWLALLVNLFVLRRASRSSRGSSSSRDRYYNDVDAADDYGDDYYSSAEEDSDGYASDSYADDGGYDSEDDWRAQQVCVTCLHEQRSPPAPVLNRKLCLYRQLFAAAVALIGHCV
jgi:hypothetical protein